MTVYHSVRTLAETVDNFARMIHLDGSVPEVYYKNMRIHRLFVAHNYLIIASCSLGLCYRAPEQVWILYTLWQRFACHDTQRGPCSRSCNDG